MKTIEFEEISVVSKDGLVKVTLDWLGEGNDGDYQENDPEDAPLLRYDVYRLQKPGDEMDSFFLDDTSPVSDPNGEWRPVADGSYCTLLRADDPKDHLILAAQDILAAISGDIS